MHILLIVFYSFCLCVCWLRWTATVAASYIFPSILQAAECKYTTEWIWKVYNGSFWHVLTKKRGYMSFVFILYENQFIFYLFHSCMHLIRLFSVSDLQQLIRSKRISTSSHVETFPQLRSLQYSSNSLLHILMWLVYSPSMINDLGRCVLF